MLKKIIFNILILSTLLLNSAHAAETGGMPQLNPEFWISQIFWLILTFGFLYVILSKIILPKISKNLETRKSQILENIETADKQKEESENKIKEYEKIIVNSKSEAKSYYNEIRQKTLADHPRCITCKRHAECAHHNQYHEVLFVERPGKDVVSMCHDCHQTFHENRSVISFHEIHELKRVN